MEMEFGEFFYEKRIERKLTLRKFSRMLGVDAGYISRLERGKVKAPQQRAQLDYFAKHLGIIGNKEEYEKFIDLANISNKSYGIDEIKDEHLLDKLPVFLRTVNNKGLNPEKLDALIDLIRKS